MTTKLPGIPPLPSKPWNESVSDRSFEALEVRLGREEIQLIELLHFAS